MRYTSNYNMTIAEGTDTVNLLTQSYPNFETVDTALKEVSDSAITSAAETKVGTVHNLVRTSPDRTIIKFTATSNFTTGDTFTVDGVAVTAVTTGGTSLKTGAFLINSNVLCILNNLVLTVLVSEVSVDASDVNYNNAGTGIVANNVQDAITEVKNAIPSVPSSYAATAITYDNSGSGLTATNAQDAIDELASAVPGAYVEVTANGSENYATLLSRLYNALDRSKVTVGSKLELITSADDEVYSVNLIDATRVSFSRAIITFSNTIYSITRITLASATSDCHNHVTSSNTSTTTFTSNDTTVPTVGTVVRITY